MLIRFGGFIALAAIAVWLWAIFDSITSPAEQVRGLPKAVWVIIVLLFLDVGAVAWFAFGRPRAAARTPGAGGSAGGGVFGGRSSAPRRISAPDDDPEFLHRLRDEMRKRDGDDPPDDVRG